MTINWFPGHMHKTRQTLEALMPSCDVVVELLDARLPWSSGNPLLDELRRNIPGKGVNGVHGDVPCVTLLTKADLADPAVTKTWRKFFEEQRGVKTLALNLHDAQSVRRLPNLIRNSAVRIPKYGKPVRAMIVGIPNVGKSTLVNALKGKRVARVGDEPAVTRGRQEIKLDSGIVLVDTPGILWPKFEDPGVGERLAVSGAIKDTVVDYTETALLAIRLLVERYPDTLRERYKLDDLDRDPEQLLEAVGKKRGCLVGGGEVDLSRAGELLLRELRSGKLGRISLEELGDVEAGDVEA
jgi:ribosome biogenesis GTPase A